MVVSCLYPGIHGYLLFDDVNTQRLIQSKYSVLSGEIFPTAIRNSGMGLVSVAARIGGMLAPFILMLGDVLPNLQFSALGLLTLLAGLLNLKLPETQGKPMPESVADILALRTTSAVSNCFFQP